VVNGNNVELTAAGAAHVTANGSLPYNIEVTVTDTGGQTSVATVTADITPFDDLPTISLLATPLVDNTAVAGSVVAAITAADEEGIASIAITSDASSYFVVNGSNVELTAAGAAYVIANSSLPYDIEVTITDSGAQVDLATVTANITGIVIDNLPSLSLATVNVTENSAVAGSVVARISAADAEGGVALSITPASDSSGYFAITGNTVTLTTDGAAYVNTNGALPYDINVSATDSGGQKVTQAIAADITPFDDLPIANLAAVTVAENSAVAGTVVANITATDEEGITSIAITSDPGSYFFVNGSNVELTTAGANFVTANGSLPYDIEVTVTDTGAQTAVATVSADITPFDNLPTVTLDAVTINENSAAAGSVLATISAADQEGITSVSVTNDPNNFYTVNGSNVELTAAGASHVTENGSLLYDIEVTVTDTGGQTDVATVTADVTPFDELPTISLEAVTIAENSAVAGTVAANITAADMEDSVTLSITPASDPNGFFAITGTTVTLTQSGAEHIAATGFLPYDIDVTATAGTQTAIAFVTAEIVSSGWTPDLEWAITILNMEREQDPESPERLEAPIIDSEPSPLKQKTPFEHAPRDAYGNAPHFSGSTDMGLFESDSIVWDSSPYLVSASEFTLDSIRYRDAELELSQHSTSAGYSPEESDVASEGLQPRLDEARHELELLARKRLSDDLVFSDLLRFSALTLLAGLLAWLLRASPMISGLVASLLPRSRTLPLPLFIKDEEEEEEDLAIASKTANND
jgi:hypothetical protein